MKGKKPDFGDFGSRIAETSYRNRDFGAGLGKGRKRRIAENQAVTRCSQPRKPLRGGGGGAGGGGSCC
jgi:hypothetical protein